MMICARQGCNENTPRGKKFCSFQCAPYGSLGRAQDLGRRTSSAKMGRSFSGVTGAPSKPLSITDSISKPKRSSPGKLEDKMTLPTESMKTTVNENTIHASLRSTQKGHTTMPTENECETGTLPIETNKEPKPGNIKPTGTSVRQSPAKSSGEEKSQLMSSIDTSCVLLMGLMKDFQDQNKNKHTHQDVNAICNCAKQIASLQRLKVEILRLKNQ